MKMRPVSGRKHSFLVLVLLFVPIISPIVVRAQTINWTKYDNTIPAISDTTSTNGRIPVGNSGKGDDLYVWFPSVLKDGSTYKMWYTGLDGANERIYYATSSNGLNWTKYDNTVPENSDGTSTNGKIPLGTSGKGDSTHAYPPSVLKDGSTYKMWYMGYDSATTNYAIYYATSSNGLEWTKYDNTIPAVSDGASTNGKVPLGTSGKGDDAGVLGPFVLKDDSPPIYKMWYTGYDNPGYNIYYATSSNGLEWTKLDNGIPAASNGSSTNGKIPRGTSGDTRAYYPCVIKDGSTYKMWYTGQDGTGNNRIYYATSSNALEWTKYDNTIPAVSDGSSTNGKIPLGSSGKGDDFNAYSPSVLKDGSTYKMWYGGYDGTAAYRIYHATYQIPPPAGTVYTFR